MVTSMNIERLFFISRMFVARNVNKHVLKATISWDDNEARLCLVYYFDHPPNDDDEELCETALTELLAEFSEIRSAATQLFQASNDGEAASLEGVVYSRV